MSGREVRIIHHCETLYPRSPFAKVEPHWARTSHALRLYHYLREKAEGTGIAVGWSSAGFAGIPPRRPTPAEATVLDLF